ncbi:DUF4432 family protein [Chitiniphilus purpureus]|uniref:DUF4432 family protein n=1 Tax=Chitiniphilus purpureus TaxID=2981137 RepID=A0ABY6DPM5_9NEIS|nr:DUF4432 family protein [Chitiniphilus sp. CD1]UXY16309.1 DUF4432 family protein [Chitiniphilus sp. CD1]
MTLILENRHLAVAVRPECGGRIDQITDLVRDKAWLWHPPGYDADAPRSVPPGASFDDHWQGGFEEMFPNDAACTVEGRALPDHGEAWSAAWQVVEHAPQMLDMVLDCKTVPVRMHKRLALAPDAPELRLRYRFTSLAAEPLPCLLKLHPALAIEEGDEITLPECDVEPVALGFSRLIGRDGVTRWPGASAADGSPVRLDRTLPAASGLREFVYCANLGEGRCGVRNARTGSHLQLHFDTADFPYVWLFQSYGGFNGHYVLMAEPCTGKPYDLNDVIRQGRALWLAPGATRTLEVTLRID